MQKKIIFVLFILLLLLVFSGCSQNSGKKGSQIAPNNQPVQTEPANKAAKEPPADSANEEQKKYPLPSGSKPYTGIIKKMSGSKLTIDIAGVDYETVITDKTNLQKGNQAGSGKLEELKSQIKINVLVQDGKALSVHYK